MRDEREILTRQSVSQKQMREARRSMIGALLMLLLGAFAFGMMYLMTQMAAPDTSVLTAVFEVALSVGFAVVCLFFFLRALVRMNKARRGAFTVVGDTLADVKEDQLSIGRMILNRRIYSRDNFYHTFHFESGRSFVANSGEYRHTGVDAAARFSLVGDTFFLVCYDDKPDRIILLYSSKIYNYKG